MSPIKDSLIEAKRFKSNFTNQREHLVLDLKMNAVALNFYYSKNGEPSKVKGWSRERGKRIES